MWLNIINAKIGYQRKIDHYRLSGQWFLYIVNFMCNILLSIEESKPHACIPSQNLGTSVLYSI